jgi:iron-sulfur cluster assembly protein
MITLTEQAAYELRSLIQQQARSSHGLRIFVQAGGCAGLQYGMSYEDTPAKEDAVVEIQDLRLFVDPFSAQFLEGACIDYQDSPMGTGFRVENPNAAATCACGISFCVEGL